jgi:hypothetical protein
MIAIYLAGYFESRLNHDKGLDKYTDEEFKAIFEFETCSKKKKRLIHEKEIKKAHQHQEKINSQNLDRFPLDETLDGGEYTVRDFDSDDEFNNLK